MSNMRGQVTTDGGRCGGHAPIWLTCVLGAVAAVAPAWALPTRVHSIISYEAAHLPGVPAEFRVAAGSPEDPTAVANSLCKGSFDEDYARKPDRPLDFIRWLDPESIWGQGSHFWDPAGGPEGGQFRLLNPRPTHNAYQRARMLYGEAVELYPDDPATAYYLLGRVAHLLEDMATPAHVHSDMHVSDSLAAALAEPILTADCLERYLARMYIDGPDLPGEVPPDGRLRFEAYFLSGPVAPVELWRLSDGGHAELGDLYKLFHSMAWQAKHWDSNGVDGIGPDGVGGGSLRWHQMIDVPFYDAATVEVWEVHNYDTPALAHSTRVEPIATIGRGRILLPRRDFAPTSRIKVVHGGTYVRLRTHAVKAFAQISDTDCRRMAADLMPQAIAHVAALYQLFWRDTHPDEPPPGSPALAGDVDDDDMVSVLDVLRVAEAFGSRNSQPAFDARCDLDDSGIVDTADLLILIDSFGLRR